MCPCSGFASRRRVSLARVVLPLTATAPGHTWSRRRQQDEARVMEPYSAALFRLRGSLWRRGAPGSDLIAARHETIVGGRLLSARLVPRLASQRVNMGRMPWRATALLLVSLTLAATLVRAAGMQELRRRRPTRCTAAPGPRAARPASFRATARKRCTVRRSAAARRSPVRWGSSPGAANKRPPCQRQAPRQQARRALRPRPSGSRSASLLPAGTLFIVGVANRDRERIYVSLLVRQRRAYLLHTTPTTQRG